MERHCLDEWYLENQILPAHYHFVLLEVKYLHEILTLQIQSHATLLAD